MKDFRDEKRSRNYKIILVDGMNLAHRYNAKLEHLSYNGHSTGMVFGVLKYVLNLRRRYPDSRIIFLWEGGSLIRKMKADFYKQGRTDLSNDFQRGLRVLRDNLTHFSVETMTAPGLEADDLAGMLTAEFAKQNRKDKDFLLLVTNDVDWLQFVSERVDISRGDTIENYHDLKSAFGYPPERVGMWKILKGDDADHIPGIPRIPSSVVRYLCNNCESYKEFRRYDLASVNTIWTKWQEEIESKWDEVIERNAMLVLYHPEWITKEAIIIVPAAPDREKATALLEEYGIKSLIEEAAKLSGGKP